MTACSAGAGWLIKRRANRRLRTGARNKIAEALFGRDGESVPVTKQAGSLRYFTATSALPSAANAA